MKSVRHLVWGCLLSLLLGCAPAWAAISVFQGTAESLTGSGYLTPSPADGTLSGDLLIAQIVVKTSATVTAPSGWTLISKASYASTSVKQLIYYLNLSSAPANSYTWTISSTSGLYRSVAAIYTLRGAVAATCGSANTADCAGSYQGGAGSTITAPNVHQTFSAGALRMAFFASNSASVTIYPALENGATEGQYLRAGSGTTGVGMDASYYLLPGDSDGSSQSASLSGNGADEVGSSLVIAAGALSLSCYSDSFDRTTGLGEDWVATKVNGSFTPSVVSNRLRLTNTGTQESTAVSLQRLFPGANNYIQLSFKYYGYNGSGADGIAVILSDGSVTPQPGGFGGSLGYAPKGTTPGFAGGWLGLGLDEYGNFSNSKDSGACAPGTYYCATSRVAQSVSIRGSATNYYGLTGTGTLGTAVSNSSGHLYRVTVDSRVSGKAQVSVERDTTGTGSSYTTLINSFNALAMSGQAAIPSNLILSLTGSTGDLTNNHEIDDLQVCAQYINPMNSINHYRFTVTTTPLTCTPAEIQVTACLDAACTKTYSGDVTATLSPSGWVGGDTQTFAGDGSARLKLSKTTKGLYTLGVSSSTPPFTAFSQATAQCSVNVNGVQSGYSAANCALLEFKDSGLLFGVPAQVSGVTSAPVTITAARKDDSTMRCVPAFAPGTRNVGFWSGYVDPATGSMSLAVNGTNLAKASPGTSLPLVFDANGQASITLYYPDAGKISLNALYTGSAANGDSGLSLSGDSTFPVVPYTLCVDSTDSGWNCTATEANAQNPANCNKFRAAGVPFNLRVTGKSAVADASASCGLATTPNYQQSEIPLSSAVFAPSGGAAGTLNPASIDIPIGGTATLSVAESEVGDFTLSAGPATYLGVTGPKGSAVFGRFVPAGFTVTSNSITDRSDIHTTTAGVVKYCASSFTYLGEPVRSDLTLKAVNSLGALTSNYTGAFARLNLATVTTAGSNGLAFGAQSGATLLNARLSANCTHDPKDPGSPQCGPFASGVANIAADLTVARATGSTVDGPFTTNFGLVATDPDGVGMRSPNFSWGLTGTNNGLTLGSATLYFGRMRLENAYGSAVLPLTVPAYAQYWNGTTFVRLDGGAGRPGDSCTPLTAPSLDTTSANAQAMYCNDKGGFRLYGGLSGVTATLNGQTALSAGTGNVRLSAPTNTGGGYLDLALGVPDYLKYNWDGIDQNSATCASSTPTADGFLHDDNPRARIRFGAKRKDGIIYLREVY